MLHVFRNKSLSSVVYGVVIIGTVTAFVINFGPNMGRQSKGIRDAFNETCALKVGNACVDPKTHRATYRLLMPRDRDGATDVNRARAMGLSKIVGDGLIERELLIREAERIGLSVTENEVTDSIYAGYIYVSVPSDNPMLSFYLHTNEGRLYAGFKDPKTKRFDEKMYKKQVAMLTGLSANEFRDWQSREILAAKMRDLVKSPVRLADEEVFSKYVREKSTAQVAYVEVKQSYAARYSNAANPAAKDVEAWAKEDAHKVEVEAELTASKESFLPKPNHIRHVLVRLSPNATPEDKQKALDKLGRAWARLQAGDAFASVARDFSDDTSNMTGGDVGDKTDGFVPSFRDAANALKAGETTDGAIESQFGYHIIYKDDPAKSAAIEAQLKKDIARRAYIKAKSTDAARDLATQILIAVKAGKSDDEAVKAAIAPLAKFTPTPPPAVKIKPMPAEGPADAGAAVKPNAAGDAGAPDAAVGDAGAAAKPPTPAVTAFTAETDPERPKVEIPMSFSRGGDPVPSIQGEDTQKLNEFAFAAKEGDVLPDLLRGEDTFVIVRAKDRKVATKEDFEKNKDSYVEDLLKEKRNETLGLYVKRLREAAKNDIKLFEENMVDAKVDGGAPTAPEDDEP